MKVKDIRLQLEQLGPSFANSSLGELLDLLISVGEADLGQLRDAIKPGLAKLAKKLEAEQKKRSALNEAGIAALLGELEQVKEDNAAFEAVLKRAAKNRTLKIPDVLEIARRFTGEARKFKSKKEAFEAVLHRQIADKRGAARSAQVSGLF